MQSNNEQEEKENQNMIDIYIQPVSYFNITIISEVAVIIISHSAFPLITMSLYAYMKPSLISHYHEGQLEHNLTLI